MNAPTEGVHINIPDSEYHAMPGLSSTGMKWLLRSPAYYRERIEHRIDTSSFDLGHAIHAKVLGVGMKVAVIPDKILASNGATSTKDARAFITDARSKGLVPVKAEVVTLVDRIAEKVLANPKARALLTVPGSTEVSLFAHDPESGVPLRGRIDRLIEIDGMLVNVDLKSTTDVRRNKIARTIENFGYDVQSETYRHLLALTTGREIAPTRLIFVEVEPPHEVRVIQLAHPDWIDGGRTKMRRAIDIYARCVATDTWPGDDDEPGEPEAIAPRPYYIDDMTDEMEVA